MIDGLALAALGIRVTVISERIETARMKGVKIIDVECSFTSTLRPATLVISKEWEKGKHMLKCNFSRPILAERTQTTISDILRKDDAINPGLQKVKQ